MRFPVFSAHVNTAVDPWLAKKPWSFVQSLMDTGAAFQVDMFDRKKGVQLRPTAPHPRELENRCLTKAAQTLGGSNVIPFARLQNKMCKPESISYPIPAAGAHNRPLWCHQINHVPPMESTI